MELVSIVRLFLSYLTFIAHLGLIYFIIILITRKFSKLKFKKTWKFFRKNSLKFAFIVSIFATLGSLFFSEIAGYDPCKLCWFQRIFMYPLVILFGLSLWKKKDYKLPAFILAFLGLLVSLYQNFPNLGKQVSKICNIDGTNCFTSFFTDLGYINIKIMCLTAFLLIIIALIMKKK